MIQKVKWDSYSLWYKFCVLGISYKDEGLELKEKQDEEQIAVTLRRRGKGKIKVITGSRRRCVLWTN